GSAALQPAGDRAGRAHAAHRAPSPRPVASRCPRLTPHLQRKSCNKPMNAQRWRTPLLALTLALAAVGVALLLSLNIRGATSGPTCIPGDRALRRIEVIFGLSREGRTDVSEAEWS